MLLTNASADAYIGIDTDILAAEYVSMYHKDIHDHILFTTEPSFKSKLLYNLYVQLITSLKWFQYRCAHGLVNPSVELTKTMDLNASIETIIASGVHICLPTLLGNVPGPKSNISSKKKLIFISELCEYIKIQSSRNDEVERVREHLTQTLTDIVSIENIEFILSGLFDVITQNEYLSFDTHILIMWIIEEYIFFSFGNKRIY